MAGEREFFLGREDADTDSLLALSRSIAANDERRLGEIGFVGEFLHLRSGQLTCIFKDSQLVSLKWCRSEDIAQAIGKLRRVDNGAALDTSLKLTYSRSGSILWKQRRERETALSFGELRNSILSVRNA